MKCSRCGRNNKPGAIVCRNCGAALVPSVAVVDDSSSSSRSSSNNDDVILLPDGSGAYSSQASSTSYSGSRLDNVKDKLKLSVSVGRGKWVLAGIAALAVIALAIVIIAAVTNMGFHLPGGGSYTVLEHGSHVNVVQKGKAALPNVAPASASCNIDASSAGIIDVNGMLYSCRDGKSRTVDANAAEVTVSDNGQYLFYTDSAARLWAFDCSKSDSLPICICSEGISSGYAVSCDGRYVLYNKQSDDSLYLCETSSGREQLLGSGLEPVSVSNGAQWIYAYSEEDCSLYLMNRNGSSSYIRGGIGERIWINYDHTEVVFTTEASNGNVKTMLHHNGKEYEIAGTALAPAFTVSMRPVVTECRGYSVITCPWNSFENKLFYGRGLFSFAYNGSTSLGSAFDTDTGRTSIVDGEGEAPYVEDGITYAVLSDDVNHLYFILNGGLYHSLKQDYSNCEKLFADCAELKAAANGSAVWFIDGSGALYCCSGSKTELAVKECEGFDISRNGREAIFISKGIAYYTKSGSASRAKCLDAAAYGVVFDQKGMYFFDGTVWKGIKNNGTITDLNDD